MKWLFVALGAVGLWWLWDGIAPSRAPRKNTIREPIHETSERTRPDAPAADASPADAHPPGAPTAKIVARIIDMDDGTPVSGIDLELRIARPEERSIFRWHAMRRTDGQGYATWDIGVPGRIWIDFDDPRYANLGHDVDFDFDPREPPAVLVVEVVRVTHMVVRVVNEEGLPVRRCTLTCEIEDSIEQEGLERDDGGVHEMSVPPWAHVKLSAKDSVRQSRTLEFDCEGRGRIEKTLVLRGAAATARVDVAGARPASRSHGVMLIDLTQRPRGTVHTVLCAQVLDVTGRPVPECKLSLYRPGEREPFLAERDNGWRRVHGPETDASGHCRMDLTELDWAFDHYLQRPEAAIVVLAEAGTPQTASAFAQQRVVLSATETRTLRFTVDTALRVSYLKTGAGAYRAGLRKGDLLLLWQGRKPLREDSVPPHWRIPASIRVRRNGASLPLVLPPGNRDFGLRRVFEEPR